MTLEERLKRALAGAILCLLGSALAAGPAQAADGPKGAETRPPLLLAGNAVQGKSLQAPSLQGQSIQGPSLQAPKVPKAKVLITPMLPIGQKGGVSPATPVAIPPGGLHIGPVGKIPALNPAALNPPGGAQALMPAVPPKAFLPPPPTNPHYSGVIMQQGRVKRDKDWNEQPGLPPAGVGSGPGQYELNRESGAIRFGDGEHGKRPPSGQSAPAAEYRSGAGQEGGVQGGAESPGTGEKGKEWAEDKLGKAKQFHESQQNKAKGLVGKAKQFHESQRNKAKGLVNKGKSMEKGSSIQGEYVPGSQQSQEPLKLEGSVQVGAENQETVKK